MESKRKNVYIVLFVITTIVAGCLAAYFGIMGNKEKDELNNQIADLQSRIDELEKKENNVQVDNSNDDKDVQENTNNDTEKVVEKVIEKGIVPIYDPNKMKNKPDNVEYTSNIIMYGHIAEDLGIKIDENGKAIIQYGEDRKKLTINGLERKNH